MINYHHMFQSLKTSVVLVQCFLITKFVDNIYNDNKDVYILGNFENEKTNMNHDLHVYIFLRFNYVKQPCWKRLNGSPDNWSSKVPMSLP